MLENKKYDFIIVGQGLAGTLLAHDLLDSKKRILIIDKHLKASASKVAGGLMNPISVRGFNYRFISLSKSNKRYL